ncbi:hypothetical protein SJI45_18845 [Streptomyces sp. S399]|uniref:hypothetical protein n=1 Tax=Streptomyces sp. S399 TaxID=3096009 RepID=UPI002A825108|nr:hypothetical protein [Streptomyces sp. S399]WPR52796.1 hypothetical protein SJI45_18845 [Streptomyces sp. S399]
MTASRPRRPHPKTAQIIELARAGHTTDEIARTLRAGRMAVARVREEAGIPPTPRTAWRTRPHPKEDQVRALLTKGYSNAEAARRTGIDPATAARIRRAASIGPSTIPPPSRPRTTTAAGQPGTDRATIARIRQQAGPASRRPPYRSAEEKWAAHVYPVDGGHLAWLGERSAAGTPIMRFRERSATPAGISFRHAHGRDPVGPVRAGCDYPHCVAPGCVEDSVIRTGQRLALRRIKGVPDPRPRCGRSHDQAGEGRFDADGRTYCEACKREDKRRAARRGATT